MWKKLLCVFSFLSVSLLFAAEGKTEKKVEELDLKISHSMWLSGPSLGNPSLHDPTGAPVNLYHSFTFKTKVSPKWHAYFQPRFQHQLAYGLAFQPLNPRIGVSHGSVYHKGNYNLSLDAALEIPSATDADQKYLQLRLSPSQSYTIGRISLGLGALIALNVFRPGKADGNTNDVGVVLYPTVSYQVNSSVSVGLDGEFSFYHAWRWGLRPLLYFEGAATTLYPNVVVTVAKNITLIPTLAIPLKSQMTLKDVGMVLQASLLYL